LGKCGSGNRTGEEHWPGLSPAHKKIRKIFRILAKFSDFLKFQIFQIVILYKNSEEKFAEILPASSTKKQYKYSYVIKDTSLYLSSDFFEKLLIFFTVAKKQVDTLCESQFHF
jgi:hypothetical protein